MCRYLVTGAAGFIGSAVAKKLLRDGHAVVTIDNLSTGKLESIPDKCISLIGNSYDTNVINKLNDYKFDAILHIAGQSSGEVSFENPIYDVQTNTQSTLMLLDYAKRTGCNHFIYASSMSVYGEQDNPFVDEQSQTIPKSFYAVGKLASEHYLRIYSATYGMSCTALRLFNVYGIGQNMDNLRQGMASIFLAMAVNDKKITVKGTKDRFRDFVYIDDVVDAFIKVIDQNDKSHYNCYNVSTSKMQTVENVIATICRYVPYKVSVEYIEGTPGDQHGIYGDYSKLEKDFAWKPTVEFEDGMKSMVDWYREGR